MADNSGPRRVVTMICVTCGNEKFFDDQVPAETFTCERCGNSVWRAFETPTQPDEVIIDALQAQARSIEYGDPSPQTTKDDVAELEEG